MKKMAVDEIRQTFTKFFVEKNHELIKGSYLVPQDDPTLLYINSGMAPLKKYFLNKATPNNPRMVNIQLCIRTKDIDEVGDRHHLTMFEMMGSWSIGDYYKETACKLAFELLVDRLEFDINRLWVTVYKGDKKLGLEPDHTSAKAWEECGISKDRIVYLGEDNFWGPAGETGPCGPCTEVFYDCGEEFGAEYDGGEYFDTTSRYIEIWNAGVFMELNKKADGSFDPLPLKSVDTGSGVERMAMVMGNLETCYETDTMKPLVDLARECFGGPGMDIQHFRILADHMRAATFIVSEGVIPTNEGRGYIPRRLLRKCVALSVKGKGKSADLVKMAELTVSMMGDAYPYLKQNIGTIKEIISREIEEFEPIIIAGLKILSVKIKATKGKSLSGTDAFEIVATHGIPLEIVKAKLEEDGYSLNEAAFKAEFEKHQLVSKQGVKKAGSKGTKGEPTLDIADLVKGQNETDFTGYHKTVGTGEITVLGQGNDLVDTVTGDGLFFFVSTATPFYGESGGQVGDKGTISSESGKAIVIDTQKDSGVFVHKAKMTEGSFIKGQKLEMNVNGERRLHIRRNHTATHMMNSALRTVLGDQVIQKGSLVDDQRLRFDFQHFNPMTAEEIFKVEALVNGWVWGNTSNDTRSMDYDSAIAEGALSLVGETYSDTVRLVKFKDVTAELCGGIHVDATGEIGLFLITGESGIARGIRRIEAVTGAAALALAQERIASVNTLSASLKTKPAKLAESIQGLVDRIAVAEKESAAAKISGAKFEQEKTLDLASGIKAFIGRIDDSVEVLKNISENKISKNEAQIVCLSGIDEGTVRVLVMIEKSLSKKVNANKILKPLLDIVGGRGGGKPNFAQGGGKDVDQLEVLLQTAETLIPEVAGPN
jgi:alanyl-tRNA synthetase